jgi:CubicO group peptidase (beta-lactamase class C family)
MVVVIALAILISSQRSKAAADSKSDAFQVDTLFATWNLPTSPGCAVAVMKDGRIMYQHGYGMADLSHDIKITPDTVFSVGSMAKQFTATAIFILAQEGKLSLDDPIRKYVPEVPNFGTPITLRQMLAHTPAACVTTSSYFGSMDGASTAPTSLPTATCSKSCRSKES